MVLGRTDHDSSGLWSGVGLDGDHGLREVDGEAGFLKRVPGVRCYTDFHSVNLIAKVVDLELEVLIGLGHQLDKGFNGLDLNDAELHDVDECVDLGRCGVGRWQVVQFLNLCRHRQLAGLHLHVGVGPNHNLEVDLLAGADVHVAGCSGRQTVAGHLDGDLFDVRRRVGNGAGRVARQGCTGLDFNLDLTGCARH